jgi:hypothetical protein
MAAGTGPARRGRKDSTLLAPAPTTPVDTGIYVCGRKPLRMGDMVLVEGVEVPGAAEWPRLEAWVNARAVRRLLEGEDYIAFETYQATWVDEHADLHEPEETLPEE